MRIEQPELITTTLALSHVRQWTISEALRELLQNYIDAVREYQKGGNEYWLDGFAYIWNKGPGLSRKALAFGHSDKMQGSIGMFGEGFKSAFVTLIREHRFIEILTDNTKITPVLRYNSGVEMDTLHYELKPQPESIEGTQIVVQCFKEEYEDARQYFQVLQSMKWIDNNKLSLPAGDIYINGSRVGHMANALFGYHLEMTADEAIKAVNRDRENVNTSCITEPCKQILRSTQSERAIAKYLKDIMGKKESWEAGWWDLSPEKITNRTLWREVFHKTFPGEWVIGHEHAFVDSQAIKMGYKVIKDPGYWLTKLYRELGLEFAINVVKNADKEKDMYTLEDLFEDEIENLKWACNMINRYYYGYISMNDISIVNFIEEGTLASYDPETERIKIARERLQNREKTLCSLLHEAIHKETGLGDEDPGYVNKMGEFLVEILIKLDDCKRNI